MKTTLTLSVLVLLVVGMFGMGERVEAKSVTWSDMYSGTLEYYTSRTVFSSSLLDVILWAGLSWGDGLVNPMVNVTYSAQLRNVTTGTLLSDDDVIPVGTKLRFEVKPYEDTDISWNGTGDSQDSPFGHWVNDADPPAFSCDAQDYVDTVITSGVTIPVYIPLSVNPPANSITHSGSAGLSCDASNINCTVTSPGTINLTVTFDPTWGNFYYRYYDYRSGGYFLPGHDTPGDFQSVWLVEGCYDNDTAMRNYAPSVPAQTITFDLTAAANDNPPTAPTITPQPFTGAVDTQSTFTFTGTDPDAGSTVRYQIDWNNDGVTDAYTAYVPSGTSQPSSYTWPTAGVKTFQARTEDNYNNVSLWTVAQATINLLAAPTVVTNPAVGDTVFATGNPSGDATTGWFRYDTTPPSSCDDTFGTRAPLAGGTALGAGSSPILFSEPLTTAPATIYYYCAIAGNAGGTGYGTVRSFLTAPAVPTGLTATPNATCSSGIIDISWDATTGATSYDIERDGVFETVVGTTYSHSGLLNSSPHTYRIRANNAGGSSAWSAPETKTATVSCPTPDLIPLDFTATGTFFDGDTIVLEGIVKNDGTLPTAVSFEDDFSYRWGGLGAWTDVTPLPLPSHPAPFAPNDTSTDNATFNPTGSGNLHIRYCVDSDSTIPGSVSNNCMEKIVRVHLRPTGTLTVTSPIPYNTTSKIEWTTANTSGCTPTVTGTNGDVWSGVSSPQTSSLLTSDTMYSLTCPPYVGALATKMVDVNAEPFIKANPRVVPSGGGNTLIEWGTGSEVDCTITKNTIPWVPSTTGLDSEPDTVNANTTYTIDCPIIDQSVKVEVQGRGFEE